MRDRIHQASRKKAGSIQIDAQLPELILTRTLRPGDLSRNDLLGWYGIVGWNEIVGWDEIPASAADQPFKLGFHPSLRDSYRHGLKTNY